MNKITQKQTPETDEALKQLRERKERLIAGYVTTYCLVIPILIVIGFYSWSIKQFTDLSIFFASVCILAVVIVEICFWNYLLPYRKQLKLAQRNDEIRHEERVRFYERKALEAGEHSQPENFNLKKHQQLMETKRKIIEQETKDIKGE